MKNTFINVLSLLIISGLAVSTHVTAASVELSLESGSFTLKGVGDLITLPSGDDVQFGYYTAATASNLFAGNFIALTGTGGVNSGLTFTQIGQETANGAGPGEFAFTSSDITFTAGSATTGVDLPSAGQIMAVRFFNAANPTLATDYGAASDSTWEWVAPAAIPPAPMSFNFDDPGVTFLNGDVGYTGTLNASLAPEPGSMSLVVVGLGALGLFYKRHGSSSRC